MASLVPSAPLKTLGDVVVDGQLAVHGLFDKHSTLLRLFQPRVESCSHPRSDAPTTVHALERAAHDGGVAGAVKGVVAVIAWVYKVSTSKLSGARKSSSKRTTQPFSR